MERRKAVIASAVVAATITLGAGAYVAGSGLVAGATDNVGNLQPTVVQPTTTTKPQEITVYVDPATGTATTVAPPSANPSQPTSGEHGSRDHQGGEQDD